MDTNALHLPVFARSVTHSLVPNMCRCKCINIMFETHIHTFHQSIPESTMCGCVEGAINIRNVID